MRLLLMLLPACLGAVTISDTLKLPDGSLANGRLIIRLVTGTHSSSTTFAAFQKTVAVTAGVVSVTLEANSQLTPAGTLYQVEYVLSSGTTQREYWSVPTGGPYAIREVRWLPVASDYSANQSGATWTVSATAHGQRTKNLIVTCFDSATPAAVVDCAVTVHPTTYAVVATFATAQTGRIHINSAACSGNCPNPAKAFTATTSVSFPNSEHGLNTARITARCYDNATPAAEFECVYTVHPTTFAVTATFATATTGTLVLSGR